MVLGHVAWAGRADFRDPAHGRALIISIPRRANRHRHASVSDPRRRSTHAVQRLAAPVASWLVFMGHHPVTKARNWECVITSMIDGYWLAA